MDLLGPCSRSMVAPSASANVVLRPNNSPILLFQPGGLVQYNLHYTTNNFYRLSNAWKLMRGIERKNRTKKREKGFEVKECVEERTPSNVSRTVMSTIVYFHYYIPATFTGAWVLIDPEYVDKANPLCLVENGGAC